MHTEQYSLPVHAILFDLDNTLFDFVAAKLAACDAVNAYLGVGNREELITFFLRDIWHLEDPAIIREYMNYYGFFSDEQYHTCVHIYETIKKTHTYPYPGVYKTLSLLHKKEIILGVVTDSLTTIAKKKLDILNLCPFITTLVTGEMTGTLKPKSDVFLLALMRLSLLPNEVLFVGDSLYRDISPSSLLGMQTAYAAYGDRNTLDEYCDCLPDFTLFEITDLIDIVFSSERVT